MFKFVLTFALGVVVGSLGVGYTFEKISQGAAVVGTHAQTGANKLDALAKEVKQK